MMLRESLENFPQGLKPGGFMGQASGTTEVVPFQSSRELGVMLFQSSDEMGGTR